MRPRWVLALLAALAIAAGFALLGQWQLERAVESTRVETHPTETIVPLDEKAQPAEPIKQTSTGQMVSVDRPLGPRRRAGHRRQDERRPTPGSGSSATWLSRPTGEPGLPVARGWAADEKTARAVADALAEESTDAVTVVGRLLPTEAPRGRRPRAPTRTRMTTVSSAALINLWADFDDQRRLCRPTSSTPRPPTGLTAIDSPPPTQEVELNWLNVFYAVEWVVFAGFAVFLWYRLVRDACEREQEEQADAAALAAAETASSAP